MGYTSAWDSKRDQVLEIARQVKNDYPDDWAIAHKRTSGGHEVPGNDRYIRRVAVEVSKVFVDCGLNGKRGDVNNLSRDILAFPNPAGCRDGSGRYLGLELRDIIVGAGGPSASLGFGDVTLDTINAGAIGAWVKPELVLGESTPRPPVGSNIPPFPPRDQTLNFVEALDLLYEEAAREPIMLSVDIEGLAVWMGEYLRHRQLGKSHDEAQALVFAEIRRIWGQ